MMWKLIFAITLATVAAATDPAEQQIAEFMQRILSEKCMKDANEMQRFMNATPTFTTCIEKASNVRDIKTKLKEPSKKEIRMEIKKLCEVSRKVMGCVDTLTKDVEVCLKDEFLDEVRGLTRAFDRFLDFSCQNNGEKIISFIDANGTECIQQRTNELTLCFNKITKLDSKFETLARKEQCTLLDEAKACAVKEMKKCSSQTPAKIADSFLLHMWDGYCNKANPGAASGLAVTLLSLLVTLYAMLIQ